MKSVNYIDYSCDTLPTEDLPSLLSYKRLSFEHEREVRAIVINTRNEGYMPVGESGIDIPVDLNMLVQSVFIAPVHSRWFKELVKRITTRYGLKCEVKQSDLDDRPLI